MAPPDRVNNRGHRISSPNVGTTQQNAAINDEYDDDPNKVVHNSENIDHILDNMFVQRAPYQPTTALSGGARKNDPIESTNQQSVSSAVPVTNPDIAAKYADFNEPSPTPDASSTSNIETVKNDQNAANLEQIDVAISVSFTDALA